MTVVVGIRVPGKGAVIMTDGQITDQDGRIYSQNANKLLHLGNVAMGACGHLPILTQLANSGSSDYGQVRNHIMESFKDFDDTTEYSLVCYDIPNDRLKAVDMTGSETLHVDWVTDGSGGQFAAGALDVLPRPKSLEAAVKTAYKAVDVACRMHANCGGLIQWYCITRKGEVTKGLLKPPKTKLGRL